MFYYLFILGDFSDFVNYFLLFFSELDIFIPSLKLAIELNGTFHYEPIFGKETLSSIQNNDARKFQACLERGIELLIIDTSSQKYFKEQSSKQFLDIIVSVIKQKRVSNT